MVKLHGTTCTYFFLITYTHGKFAFCVKEKHAAELVKRLRRERCIVIRFSFLFFAHILRKERQFITIDEFESFVHFTCHLRRWVALSITVRENFHRQKIRTSENEELLRNNFTARFFHYFYSRSIPAYNQLFKPHFLNEANTELYYIIHKRLNCAYKFSFIPRHRLRIRNQFPRDAIINVPYIFFSIRTRMKLFT